VARHRLAIVVEHQTHRDNIGLGRRMLPPIAALAA
jgi:hypothetical protein